ncbi:MAG: GNAT family N-acetyltransferase, partial [Candidatus Cryptobacteroides sp.]
MEYSIRQAAVEDAGIIRQIADVAFRATYAAIISPGQIDYMMEWMYSESTLRKEICGNVTYLLLQADGKDIGYVSFGPENRPENSSLFHLHKIYLLPECQGRGYGKLLFKAAEEAMKKNGAEAYELNVNRHNKALNFYLQMGMHIARSGDFDIGG